MFYRLILAHLVGDFVFQNGWLVRRKRTVFGLALHVGLVGLAMLPALWGQMEKWWSGMLVILAVHAVADWSKIRLEPRLPVSPIIPFLVDPAVHVATIGAVVVLTERNGASAAGAAADPVWWIASVYLIATYALSIALPLWLDPPSLMRRSFGPRLILIGASALVLTLAWRGLPLLIPVVGLGLYQAVARRLARNPVTPSFAIEFLAAIMLAASLGWGLR